ncbi:MAG: NAD-dependent epimerase/dehydratase family protein [Bacteroidetes bacterium]|nr:NAD-dependent epimerase/dehydratase family protein [Bacteroidota bacterium]
MILLTGATGFLGSHVCATLLENGYQVRACRRINSSLQEFHQIMKWRLGNDWEEQYPSPEWVYADILDYESLMDAMSGVEAVFHVAAIVSFWSKRRDELFEVNVEGTANVVDACLESEIPWMIHTSSIAAIGRDDKHPQINENSEWINTPNNSQYAISKHLAELEVWRGREEGLKASMVNPGIILGEGDWTKGSCRLLKKIADGLPYYTQSQNGYVDVIDVAKALLALYQKRIDGERFILVGESLTARDLIQTGAQVFGNKEARIEIHPWMMRIAAYVSTLISYFNKKEPLITKETAATATHTYQYATEKSKNELNIQYNSLESLFRRIQSII